MKRRYCCFTGHRELPQEIISQLERSLYSEIEKLIKQGVLFFKAGGARGFDTLSAYAVLKLKKIYPEISLILVLPCKNQTKGWCKSDIEKYRDILQKADEVIYTSEEYYKGCMFKRNRRLLEHTGYCICYLTKETGGTKYTVNRAIKKGIVVINVP